MSLLNEAKRITINFDQCASALSMFQNEPVLAQTIWAIWGILMSNGVKVEMGKTGNFLNKKSTMDEEANIMLQPFSKEVMIYLVLWGIVPFWIHKKGKERQLKVPLLGSGYIKMELDPESHMPVYLWFWTDGANQLINDSLTPFKKMRFYEVNRPTSDGTLMSVVSKFIGKYNYIRHLSEMFKENENQKLMNEPIQQMVMPPLGDKEFPRFLDYDKLNNRDRETTQLLNDNSRDAYMKRYAHTYHTPETSLYSVPSGSFDTQSLDADLYGREEQARALSNSANTCSQVYGNMWGSLVKPVFRTFHNMDTKYIERLQEYFRADVARTLGFSLPSSGGSGSKALSEGLSLERNYISSRINEYKMHFENILTAAYVMVKKEQLNLMDEIVAAHFDEKIASRLDMRIVLEPTIIISDSISKDIGNILIDDPESYFEYAKALTGFDMEGQLKSNGKKMPTFDSLKRKRLEKKERDAPPEKKKKSTK